MPLRHNSALSIITQVKIGVKKNLEVFWNIFESRLFCMIFAVYLCFFAGSSGFFAGSSGFLGPNEAFSCEFGTIFARKSSKNQGLCQNLNSFAKYAQEFAFPSALLSNFHSNLAQTPVFQPFSQVDLWYNSVILYVSGTLMTNFSTKCRFIQPHFNHKNNTWPYFQPTLHQNSYLQFHM